MNLIDVRKLYEKAADEKPGPLLDYYNLEKGRLPQELQTALEGADPFNQGEFMQAYFRGTAAKPKPPEEPKAEPTEPAPEADGLLPFSKFPGYALDVWGRPHGVSGQGRKRGPLTPDKHWKPRKKGEKPTFVWRFRLYRDGKRVDRSAKFCMIVRHNAERALWNPAAGEYEELRSMGVQD